MNVRAVCRGPAADGLAFPCLAAAKAGSAQLMVESLDGSPVATVV